MQRRLPTETRVPVRYEPGLGANFPDLTPTGKTWGFPIPRGTSADGLVMVGAAADGQVIGANSAERFAPGHQCRGVPLRPYRRHS